MRLTLAACLADARRPQRQRPLGRAAAVHAVESSAVASVCHPVTPNSCAVCSGDGRSDSRSTPGPLGSNGPTRRRFVRLSCAATLKPADGAIQRGLERLKSTPTGYRYGTAERKRGIRMKPHCHHLEPAGTEASVVRPTDPPPHVDARFSCERPIARRISRGDLLLLL